MEVLISFDSVKCPVLRGPTVAILMATYEGCQYLDDQMRSIFFQSFRNWKLWVSDDSARDETWQRLTHWQSQLGPAMSIVRGGRRGVVANFMSLVCSNEISADYYAFSDQDDVWGCDKLERAIDWLNGVGRGRPALYCSRTLLVDDSNRIKLGVSPPFSREPGFANALVQSIAGGNTMVFNKAACELLREAGGDVDVVVHDWWVYLVVAGCGGAVHFDQRPSLRYRQHGNNLIGAGDGVKASLERIWHTHLKGVYRGWIDRNVRALERLRHRMTPENVRRLQSFLDGRGKGPLGRVAGIRAAGVYRQTWTGNASLYLSAFLGKL